MDQTSPDVIYARSYLRPDGSAPLIGDTDSGQINCQLYAAAPTITVIFWRLVQSFFEDPGLKLEGMEPPEELFWLLGEEGVLAF